MTEVICLACVMGYFFLDQGELNVDFFLERNVKKKITLLLHILRWDEFPKTVLLSKIVYTLVQSKFTMNKSRNATNLKTKPHWDSEDVEASSRCLK